MISCFFDVRSLSRENAEMTLLLHRSGRLAGQVLRPQWPGMKTVVGNQDNRGIRVDFSQQATEQPVVIDVGIVDDLVETTEFRSIDPGKPVRIILHEAMAEMVERVKNYGRKIPGFMMEKVLGHIADERTLENDPGQNPNALILIMVNRLLPDKLLHQPRIDLLRMLPQPQQLAGQPSRMHGARTHGPGLAQRRVRMGVTVRDHHTVDGLGRMRSPPAHYHGFFVILVQNVPDGLCFAGQHGNRPDKARISVRLFEPEHAVTERTLAVATEVHNMGESAGYKVAMFPLTPFCSKPARWGNLPALSSGAMIFQSAPSQPMSRTF